MTRRTDHQEHPRDSHDHQDHEHDQHEGHHDHTEHHTMMIADFKRRLYVSLVLSIPVLALSPMIQSFVNYSIEFPGNQYVLFLVSAIGSLTVVMLKT